ncbi:MAG: hypothetical protein V1804_01295 [Patescibacteria group bacterium]
MDITAVDLNMFIHDLQHKDESHLTKDQRGKVKSALSETEKLLRRLSGHDFIAIPIGKYNFIQRIASEKPIVQKPKPRFNQIHPL